MFQLENQSFGKSYHRGLNMPLPVIRYALDPTGINPDNRVVGEIHNLSSRDIRAVAPIYGAYFTDSLRVYDNSTDRLLARGADYQCVELLQDASLKYGKEICLVVLVINKEISNQVRINYQVLGGGFQNQATAILNLYENVIKDERPVDWVNVLNKPLEYNPSLHQHLINDVVGFQALIHSIERVRNAIILSDVPAYEALLDHIHALINELKNLILAHMSDVNNPHLVTKAQIELDNVENLPIITEEDILTGDLVRKYVTYDMLVYVLQNWIDNSSYRLVPNTLSVQEGRSLLISVETTNVTNGTKLYWTIQHLTTTDSDFGTVAGVITIDNDLSYFTVPILYDSIEDLNESFRVLLRKDSPTGKVIASTSVITVEDIELLPEDKSLDYFNAINIYDPTIELNPASLFIIHSRRKSGKTRFSRTGLGLYLRPEEFTYIGMDACMMQSNTRLAADTLFIKNSFSVRGK